MLRYLLQANVVEIRVPNREHLLRFAGEHKLFATSACFQHCSKHINTLNSPYNQHSRILDIIKTVFNIIKTVFWSIIVGKDNR